MKAEGAGGFRRLTGCILSNELHDNFPVHRFAVRDGALWESRVTVEGDRFVEALVPPPTALRDRLVRADVPLIEGLRGSPVPLQAQMAFQKVGLVVIGGLVVFSLVNDSLRLVERVRSHHDLQEQVPDTGSP